MNFNINNINFDNLCLFCQKIFVKYLNNLKVQTLFMQKYTVYFKFFLDLALKLSKLLHKKFSSETSRNIFFNINFYKV